MWEEEARRLEEAVLRPVAPHFQIRDRNVLR
jgi:hypothetical protein